MKGGSCFSFSGEEAASLKEPFLPVPMHWPSLVAVRLFPRQPRLTPVGCPAAEPPLESIRSLSLFPEILLCPGASRCSLSKSEFLGEETPCATLNETVTLMTGETVWPPLAAPGEVKPDIKRGGQGISLGWDSLEPPCNLQPHVSHSFLPTPAPWLGQPFLSEVHPLLGPPSGYLTSYPRPTSGAFLY